MKNFVASSGCPGPNSSPANCGCQKLLAAAAGAVPYEHSVAHDALRIAHRLTEGAVVNAQLRQGLPGGEGEIPDDVVAFRDASEPRAPIGRRCQERQGDAAASRQARPECIEWRFPWPNARKTCTLAGASIRGASAGPRREHALVGGDRAVSRISSSGGQNALLLRRMRGDRVHQRGDRQS